MTHLSRLIDAYNAQAPLSSARTIPSAWYLDPAVAALEQRSVFSNHWIAVGRIDALQNPGDFFTCTLAGEPLVIVRSEDGVIRGFFNVCRHHAAEVATETCGHATSLRCPYHGWTYGLDGHLMSAAEFKGVEQFDKTDFGLVPVRTAAWEHFVFVCLDPVTPELPQWLDDVVEPISRLDLPRLRFWGQRRYTVNCNWKVFVDNYLDGGYHVPHIHQSLSSVLDYSAYRIDTGSRHCVQWSAMTADGESDTAAVRGGDTAYYYWIYPNFMLNWYEGILDTNLVLPLAPDRCEVIFDFYFDSTHTDAAAQSVDVSDRVQLEDIAVCESVQRGLASRSYDVGRLSVTREEGEHLFHRLLHRDLSGELDS
jgi:choline monooxygenase